MEQRRYACYSKFNDERTLPRDGDAVALACLDSLEVLVKLSLPG
jgi:hypothetical protein